MGGSWAEYEETRDWLPYSPFIGDSTPKSYRRIQRTKFYTLETALHPSTYRPEYNWFRLKFHSPKNKAVESLYTFDNAPLFVGWALANKRHFTRVDLVIELPSSLFDIRQFDKYNAYGLSLTEARKFRIREKRSCYCVHVGSCQSRRLMRVYQRTRKGEPIGPIRAELQYNGDAAQAMAILYSSYNWQAIRNDIWGFYRFRESVRSPFRRLDYQVPTLWQEWIGATEPTFLSPSDLQHINMVGLSLLQQTHVMS